MISTTAADHDSAGFMRALGGAYRASGRRHSIVDTFARNPYPENAAVALVRSGRVDYATVAGVAGAPLPPEKPRPSGLGVR